MTDVLTLPVTLSPEGTRRMAARLKRDALAGVELGPRGPQIECLTASLSRSLGELSEELRHAVAVLPEGDPVLCGLRDAASGMTRLAQFVMAGAAGLQTHPGAQA